MRAIGVTVGGPAVCVVTVTGRAAGATGRSVRARDLLNVARIVRSGAVPARWDTGIGPNPRADHARGNRHSRLAEEQHHAVL